MGAPSIGAASRLVINNGSDNSFEFVSESIKKRQELILPPGIRGTRSRNSSRVRKGVERIGGSITLHPNVFEIDILWPLILGGATSGGVTKVAETLPEFSVIVDRVAVGKNVFTYGACRVGRATFRGSPGDYLELTLDIEAETETTGTVFPSYSPNTASRAWIFHDVDFVFAADASATEVLSFELVIDNVLNADRYYTGAITRSQIPATDRLVTLNVTFPWTADEIDLHDLAVAGGTGSMSWNDKAPGGSAADYTLDFANLKAPTDSPVITGRTETTISMAFQAFKVGNVAGTTDEIMVTKV